MRKPSKNRRYIYDALYGPIYLPESIWDIIQCPELQRLREIRLCNINSFCLTGGANINRYEHAIGTCYLAQECLNSWPLFNPLSEEERRIFLFAVLLHDVLSGAFGHSVQYIEGFEHEKELKYAVFGESGKTYRYKFATSEPIFFGMMRELPLKLSKEDIERIGEITAGKGRFGPLVNGIMDLDNIDNVFRLAYHIGLAKSGDVPLKLAKSLYIGYSEKEKSKLIVKEDAVPLIEEWYKMRKKLYFLLLQNPEEFSAKCMLTEAIELSKIKNEHPFNWFDVDYDLLEKLHKTSLVRVFEKEPLGNISGRCKDGLNRSIISEELKDLFKCQNVDIADSVSVKIEGNGWKIYDGRKEYFVTEKKGKLTVYKMHVKGIDISNIISRLMRGDLYGCIGIFSTPKTEKHEIFINPNKRREIEDEITYTIRSKEPSRFKSSMVALHSIIDVNKTERQVCIQTNEGKVVKIGQSSNRLLIGGFFKNQDLNMYKLDSVEKETMYKIREIVYTCLSEILEDPHLQKVDLYGEINECN